MILHIDMDAFYASVEERDNPALVGKPVIVGGSPQRRGVVCAANYVARTFGVHSAMPEVKAHRLCPQAVFLPSRMDYYAEISRQIRDIFHRYTPLVEPLSLDEAFLEVTGSEGLFGSSVEIGRKVKAAIRDELDLVASVGVAPNKFLAKLASDLEKPDGFVVVDPNYVQAFLDPLPVGRLWGVGKATGTALERLSVRTIGDLRNVPLETVTQHLGEHGRHLWELAHGMDARSVIPDREAKSISHETTFAEDIDDIDVLRAWVVELSEHVGRRLRQHHLHGRTVALKVRYQDFQTITRSTTLPTPTNVTQEISRVAGEMLLSRLPGKRLSIRLLGVGVSGLDAHEPAQRTLFDLQEHESQASVDQATDQIRDKFGTKSIGRGSGLLHGAKHTPPPRLP